ncbi:MAG: SPOR domain-containing protein [Gammaproteobacteria bacterium]
MRHFSKQPLDQLEPGYLSQYGLYKAPFTQEIDDKFLFIDADRSQRLNMLHHLTQYSDLLLIVTGEEGVGKTSLLHRFEIMADDDWQICNINANALMDSDQLIRNIISGFGFNTQYASSNNIKHLFIEDLSELKHSGIIPILVIDDAHELPIETLESIFQLADTELNGQRLLRVILFSDPTIDVTLKSSKISHLQERVTHSMELTPFSEEQTEQYIYHRLTVAGLKGDNPIDQKILRRIYRGSDGYPDQINKLTHIALQDGVDDANNDALFSELNYHFPTRKYLISGSIAAIIIGIVLTIQDTINDLFEDSEQIVLNLPMDHNASKKKIEIEKKVIIKTKPVAPPSNEKNTATKKQDMAQTISVAEKPAAVALPVQAIKEQPKVNLEERIILLDKELKSSSTDPLDTTVVTTKPETTQNSITQKTVTAKEIQKQTKPILVLPEIKAIKPQTIFASKKPQQLSLIGSGFSERSFVTVKWANNTKRLSSQQVKVINDKLIEISLTTGLKPEEWAVTITHPKNGKSLSKTFHVIQTEQQLQTSKSTNIKDENWILSQNKEFFTLQLLGAKNKDDIIKFANKKKFKGQYAMFTSVRNGEIWYHLIYGTYKDKVTALNTVQAIPKKIGIGKPWIRPLLDVQNAIKRQKENQAITKISAPANVAASKKTSPIRTASSVPNSVKEQSSWLWGQSPTHYTLQLLGARTESSVKKFVLQHKLQGKAIYFNVKRQGKDWFALVYGVYPDKGSAIKARSALSKSLQKAKPWPRNFASIHAELSKAP